MRGDNTIGTVPATTGQPPGRWPFLAPFATRSFRFQWPADLCTAWALEMETLILGWYVLVQTGYEVFAALQRCEHQLNSLRDTDREEPPPSSSRH